MANTYLRDLCSIGQELGPLGLAQTSRSDAYNPPRVMKLWLQILQFLIADVFSHKISSGEKISGKAVPWGGPQSEAVRLEKKYSCHFELKYLLILK